MTRPPIIHRRRDWALHRRDLLRALALGAGALPLLGSGRARGQGGSKKLICVLQTGGYQQSAWRPLPGPVQSPLPGSLTPLGPHVKELLFLPALANPHHTGTRQGAYGTIFWGLPERSGGQFPEPGGATVDQVVAQALPARRLRTLALQVQVDLGAQGRPRGFRRCFWTGAGSPVEPEGDPLATYQRLFASGVALPAPDPALERLLAERRSMLDYVGKALTQFQNRLGGEERQWVGAHLQALRDVETRLGALRGAPLAGCPGPVPPANDVNDPDRFPAILAAQISLATAALHCGLTRVVTVQLSNAAGANVDFGRFVPGIPAGGPAALGGRTWADLAVAPPNSPGEAMKQIADRWCMEHLAGLIGQLKALPGPSGSLFEDTVVLWANHLLDASDDRRVPWLLAGSAGGHFATGRCDLTPGRTVASVLAELCQALGVPGTPFGATTPGLRRAARSI